MSSRTSKRLKRTADYFDAVQQAAPTRVVNVMQDKQIARIKRQLSKLEGDQEKKQINSTILNTGVGTSGLLHALDSVAQGDSSVTRSGIRIRPTALEWNLILESEVADAYNSMRLMIVQSKKGPLTSADFAGVNIPSTEVQLSRYNVLYDRHFLLESIHSGDAGDPRKTTRYYQYHNKIKLNKLIHYPDAPATTATTGNLYAWFISDSSTINHPDVEVFQTKISFQDD